MYNLSKFSTFLLVGNLAWAMPAHAGSSVSAKEVISVQPAEPDCSSRQIQPLFSRYAQTTKKWTVRGSYRSFKDVGLQEVDEFDGSSYDIELTVPLSECWQLRLYYPIQTEGSGRDIDTGEDVDVSGNGGMLDFPSLIVDYQFKQASSPSDFNLAAYAGVSTARDHLEAENQVDGGIDRINHRGSAAILGFKADKQLNHCWAFIGNLGGRYYWESDDIHPYGGSDTFFLIDASAAFVYAPQSAWAYPMVELVYQGNFSDYDSLQIVPQVVVPVGEHLDINVGVSLGILDDGPTTDARLQMTLRF
jgi:hypothetical protein